MLEKILKVLFAPITFGLLFLAPLVMQIMQHLEWSPYGFEPLWVGLAVGAALGLTAQFRGSWLWVK